MQKAYNRIVWENRPSQLTPLGQTNLNKMDVALDTLDDRIITLDSTKANQSDLLQSLKNVTYNETTGVFTFTWWNGTTYTADLNVEKIPVSFSMSSEGIITMVTADGTTYTADLSDVLKAYSFVDSSVIDFTITTDSSGNKIVTAGIVDGSITEDKLQPNFLSDCRVASSSAQLSASSASESSLESEGYAVGTQDGVPTSSGSPYYHNNAKYWCSQAQQIAGGGVTSFNGRSGIVNPAAGDYDATQVMYETDVTLKQKIADVIASIAGYIPKPLNPMNGQLLKYSSADDRWEADTLNVYNSTITIQKNGADVDSFTTNRSSNKSINITMSKSDVGLGNVDNTSDLNKPISTATQTALDAKANNSDVTTALGLKLDTSKIVISTTDPGTGSDSTGNLLYLVVE